MLGLEPCILFVEPILTHEIFLLRVYDVVGQFVFYRWHQGIAISNPGVPIIIDSIICLCWGK